MQDRSQGKRLPFWLANNNGAPRMLRESEVNQEVAVDKLDADSCGKPVACMPPPPRFIPVPGPPPADASAGRVSRRPAWHGTNQAPRSRHRGRTVLACPHGTRLWTGMWKTRIWITENRRRVRIRARLQTWMLSPTRPGQDMTPPDRPARPDLTQAISFSAM